MNPRIILLHLLLAFILFAGFACAWSLVAVWILEGTRASRFPKPYEWITFLEDGTPVIAFDAGRFRDLNGKELNDVEEERLAGVSLPRGMSRPSLVGKAVPDDRVRGFADNSRPQVNWFFITQGTTPGTGYMVGYEKETATRVGFVGTAGFRADALSEKEQFPFSSGQPVSLAPRSGAVIDRIYSRQHYRGPWLYYTPPHAQRDFFVVFIWGDDGKVYRVDLAGRTVDVALEDLELRSLGQDYGASPEEGRAIFRKDNAVVMVSSGGAAVRTYPIPAELRDSDFEFWAPLSKGESVLCIASADELRSPYTEYKVYWIDAVGRVTRHVETKLARPDERFRRWAMAGVTPGPVILGVVVAFDRAARLMANGQADSYSAALGQAFDDFWPAFLLVALVGAGLAWLCYRREVLFASGPLERFLWPVFILLFGLPGWIGYRYGRSWPMLERCPACGRHVPRNSEWCPKCQAEFPISALKGNEVFA